MKRIVVCCDGTWNRPDQFDRGKLRPTNVTKIALAIAPHDQDGNLQQVYYRRGVGTDPWEQLRGGAFGMGLSRNTQDAYQYLIKHYEPGDELFLFGFSRGAYTVRSLAGLIRNSGLLRREHSDRLREAYALYRRRDRESHPVETEATLFRKTYSYESLGHSVRIKLIGVWDTVGALGIPIGWLGQVSRRFFRLEFHDVKLSSYVDSAFQALAIDERRRPFEPSIWEWQPHAKGQRLEQVWFAGVHSDVGGGYEDSGLSDNVFKWMKERAVECDLAFDEAYLSNKVDPDPMGKLHESRTGLYLLLPPRPRELCKPREAQTFETVHSSAWERRQRDASYRPKNLPQDPVPPTQPTPFV